MRSLRTIVISGIGGRTLVIAAAGLLIGMLASCASVGPVEC